MTEDPFAPSEGPLGPEAPPVWPTIEEPALGPTKAELMRGSGRAKAEKAKASTTTTTATLTPSAGSYVVLCENEDRPGEYAEVGVYEAANSDAAVRAAAGDLLAKAHVGEGGARSIRLVACPARSWQPRTASVRPTPAITLS